MANTTFTKKELNVPSTAIVPAAEVLLEHEIPNSIIGADTENDQLILEVQYDKGQRDIIHHVMDLIDDYEESDEEEDDEDDDA